MTKFSDIMKSRGWDHLPCEYIDTEYKNIPAYGDFTAKILKNGHMITENKSSYHRIVSTSEYTPAELFGKDHDINFKFKQDRFDCKREGHCGFMLRVTAVSGEQDDSFNIQLVTNPDRYPNDLHFHEGSSSVIGDFHLALDILADGFYKRKDTPITWYGKPGRDKTTKFWCWGANMFYYGVSYQQILLTGGVKYKHIRRLSYYSNIRLVVYFSSGASS